LPQSVPPHAARLGTPPRSDADRLFDGLADRLLAHELESAPIAATELGIHDYDALMPATDTLGIARAHAARAELRSRSSRAASIPCSRANSARRAAGTRSPA
jgi:hypothetical protein